MYLSKFQKIEIHPDIRQAETLPAWFYNNEDIFEQTKDKIFRNTWHLLCDSDAIKIPGTAYPITLYEGFLDEPILLTRDFDDKLHCLSNVCTHRGNILVENAGVLKNIRCRYHGRMFDLSGRFKYMPECDDALNFPREEDNLSNISFGIWKNFIFTSVNPLKPLDNFLKPIDIKQEGISFEPIYFEPTLSRDYLVKCNWALYVENYLEGFHIPYVHSGLNEKLDYNNYETYVYELCNLQLGIANKGELCFKLSEISPDYGKEIAAYYWWVFPNLMLNFYPWGLSINIVKPISVNLTKISFLTYIYDETKLGQGAGAGLDRVEREDEAIVEMVQKGMKSSFYKTGRYSPKREQGVHHFHRLIAEFINCE
jgi:choline monooxygenase